jgi:hypothetical protein
MNLFERVHMPSFAGATEWLNSEPLGPAELRGHVVLVPLAAVAADDAQDVPRAHNDGDA